MTRIKILNISMGQENTFWFDDNPYSYPQYFQEVGKYSVENEFTAFSTKDG
jgi:hypothetical protein